MPFPRKRYTCQGMKKLWVTLVLAAITTCAVGTTLAQGSSYDAPEVISATDAYLPYQVIFDGFVVLDVSLDAKGNVAGVTALRDPGSMVPAAITSVRTWKFRPASAGSGPRPSEMTVAFVYRPQNGGPAQTVPPKNFRPVFPGSPTAGELDYVPPGIISVTYPDYPVDSLAWGSIVIQITVNSAGKAEDTQVLRGMVHFTNFAVSAIKKWQFQPATLRGKPVPSKLAVAFVFQTPSGN
jgi:TonB family protein